MGGRGIIGCSRGLMSGGCETMFKWACVVWRSWCETMSKGACEWLCYGGCEKHDDTAIRNIRRYLLISQRLVENAAKGDFPAADYYR